MIKNIEYLYHFFAFSFRLLTFRSPKAKFSTLGFRLLTLSFALSTFNSSAQSISIAGSGSGTPDASAILDLDDTTRGFLPPRLTTVQMNAVSSPAEGLFVFNTDSLGYMFYNGSNWVLVTKSGETQYSVPAGTIIPFAGDKTNLPSGFLFCDGSLISTTTYSELFAAISYSWGGSGASFNVPDLRGRFLRGIDDGAGNDPDAASRTAINTGGNTGDNVGSQQDDAIRNMTGAIRMRQDDHAPIESANGVFSVGNSGTRSNLGSSSGTGYTTANFNASNSVPTGADNRPKNAAVTYIICYSSSIAAAGGSGEFQGNINGSQISGTIPTAQLPESVTDSTRITDSDNDTYITTQQSADDDTLRFFTDGTQKMSISPKGNIGIGISNAVEKLDIIDTSDVVGFRIGSNALDEYLKLDYNRDFAFSSIQSGVFGGVSRPLILQGGGGLLGIGTTIPEILVDIRSHDTDADAIFRTANSDRTHFVSIFPGRLNDPNPFVMWKEGDPLRFATDESGFTERMRITSNGYVGIGTSTPTLNLVLTDSTGSSILGIHAANSSGDAQIFYISDGSAEFVSGYDKSSGLFKIGPSISSNTFVMNSTGHVGLGTLNPTDILHLSENNGDANILIEADTDNNNEADNPRLLFAQDGGVVSGFVGFEGTAGTFSTNTISNALMMGTDGEQPLQFLTNSTVNMTILDNGNVGVGTNAPDRRLHVEGSQYVTTVLESDNTAGTWLVFNNTTTGGKFHHILTTGSSNGSGPGEMRFGYGNSDATVTDITMTLEDEKVGIGTRDPIAPLHVVTSGSHTVPLLLEGDAEIAYTQANDFEIVQVNGSGTITNRRFKISSGGNVTIDGGSTTVTSDSAFKINVTPIENVLSDLVRLEGVYHHWDTVNTVEGRFQSRRVIGMIAQKLQRVYPELVVENEEGYLSVDYSKFSAVLLQAIKEQQQQIEALQAAQSNAKLQRIENEKLRLRIERLEKLLIED